MADSTSFFKAVCQILRGDVDKAFDTMNNSVSQNNFSSVAAKASEGILQFPLIVSNSIDYDTAVLTAKACERAYASFVSVVFSMNRDLADVNTNNVSDYLRRFHDNYLNSTTDSGAPGGIGLDTAMTARDKYNQYQAGSTESFSFEDNGTKYTCTLIDRGQYVNPVLKEQLKPYIENFCLTKLNDKFKPRSLANAQYTVPMITLEAKGGKGGKGGAQTPPPKPPIVARTTSARTNVELTNSDVKKANELQPLMIKLCVQRNNGTNIVTYDINVGIKATVHMVTTDEFVSNMVDACEYKGKLFRFIRWTTGEISFLRDFVLNMDLFEKETKNRAYGNSNWWEALKRRGRDAKMSKIESRRLLPNATLVFSRTEVDYIKANYGYDLLSTKIAKRLMEEYFLLGYVVLDTSSEIATILYDGQKNFQQYTFKALERENSDTARQFADMMKALRHS